jgi:hypothetical protein
MGVGLECGFRVCDRMWVPMSQVSITQNSHPHQHPDVALNRRNTHPYQTLTLFMHRNIAHINEFKAKQVIAWILKR